MAALAISAVVCLDAFSASAQGSSGANAIFVEAVQLYRQSSGKSEDDASADLARVREMFDRIVSEYPDSSAAEAIRSQAAPAGVELSRLPPSKPPLEDELANYPLPDAVNDAIRAVASAACGDEADGCQGEVSVAMTEYVFRWAFDGRRLAQAEQLRWLFSNPGRFDNNLARLTAFDAALQDTAFRDEFVDRVKQRVLGDIGREIATDFAMTLVTGLVSEALAQHYDATGHEEAAAFTRTWFEPMVDISLIAQSASSATPASLTVGAGYIWLKNAYAFWHLGESQYRAEQTGATRDQQLARLASEIDSYTRTLATGRLTGSAFPDNQGAVLTDRHAEVLRSVLQQHYELQLWWLESDDAILLETFEPVLEFARDFYMTMTSEQPLDAADSSGAFPADLSVTPAAPDGFLPPDAIVGPNTWGPDIVMPTGANLGYQMCSDRSDRRTCLAENGMRAGAIAFSMNAQHGDLAGFVFATKFQELGRVDLGVTEYQGASPIILPVFLNGSPDIISISGLGPEALGRFDDDTSQSVRRSNERLSSTRPSVAGHRLLSNGDQVFVVANPLSTCRACANEAVALVEHRFTANGRSERPIGILDRGFEHIEGHALRLPTLSDLRREPRLAQYLLNIRGYGAGEMDGILGPATRNALQAFQAEFCLPVTGQLSAATETALLEGDRFTAPCAGQSPPQGVDALNPLLPGTFVSNLDYCARGTPWESAHNELRVVKPDATIMFGYSGLCETRRTDLRDSATVFRGTCFEENQSNQATWAFDILSQDAFVETALGQGTGLRYDRCPENISDAQNPAETSTFHPLVENYAQTFAAQCNEPGIAASSLQCPYVDVDRCEGELCLRRGALRARATATLFAAPGSTVPVSQVAEGDWAFNEYTETWLAPCTSRTSDNRRIWRLRYVGEGFVEGWDGQSLREYDSTQMRDEVVQMGASNPCLPGHRRTWRLVRTTDDHLGWTSTLDSFDWGPSLGEAAAKPQWLTSREASSAMTQADAYSIVQPSLEPTDWQVLSAPSFVVEAGQTQRGITLHAGDVGLTMFNGQSVFTGPGGVDLSSTRLDVFVNPQGSHAVAIQHDQEWGYRAAVLDLAGQRVLNGEIIAPNQVRGIGRARDVRTVNFNSVAWSPGGRYAVLAHSATEWDWSAAVVDMRNGTMGLIRPQLQAGQLPAPELETLRRQDGTTHQISFGIARCSTPACEGLTPLQPQSVSFRLGEDTLTAANVANAPEPAAPTVATAMQAIARLTDGRYGRSRESCALDPQSLGDAWRIHFKDLRKPEYTVGYETSCTIRGAVFRGDQIEINAACSAEGEPSTRTDRWTVLSQTSFRDHSVYNGPVDYVLCEARGPEPARQNWTAAIVHTGTTFDGCIFNPDAACLDRFNLSPETRRFADARLAAGASSVIPVDFQELGAVDVVHLDSFGSAGSFPYLINTTPDSVSRPPEPERNLSTLASRGNRLAQSMLRQFPQAEAWRVFFGGMRVLPNGYQRFSVVVPWTEFCRACAHIGYNVATVDYDQNGRFRAFEAQGILDNRALRNRRNTDGTYRRTATDMQQFPALIQYYLNLRGYKAGPIDGAIGPRSRAALAEFQRENGINQGTGQIDQRTLAALANDQTLFSNGTAVQTQSTAVSGSAPAESRFTVIVLDEPLDWWEASAIAAEMGGSLATINSQSEQEEVWRAVQARTDAWVRNSAGFVIGPWLGGFQSAGAREPDGGWRWVGGTPFTYQNWITSREHGGRQPNNSEGVEDALVFMGLGRMSPRWNDYPSRPSGVGWQAEIRSFVLEHTWQDTATTPAQSEPTRYCEIGDQPTTAIMDALMARNLKGRTASGRDWSLWLADERPSNFAQARFTNAAGETSVGTWYLGWSNFNSNAICQSYNGGSSYVCHDFLPCLNDAGQTFVMRNETGEYSSIVTTRDRVSLALPSTGGTTSGAPSTVLAALANGIWSAPVSQPSSPTSYSMTVESRQGVLHVDYPELSCGGIWEREAENSNGTALLRERIRYGTNRCSNNGYVTLFPQSQNQIRFEWRYTANGQISASADLATNTASPQAGDTQPTLGQALSPAVAACWNLGSVAPSTSVTVGFQLARDGRPVTDSISLVEGGGGTPAEIEQAFEAARRAILRCGRNGFDLPVDSYSTWQNLQARFDASGMAIQPDGSSASPQSDFAVLRDGDDIHFQFPRNEIRSLLANLRNGDLASTDLTVELSDRISVSCTHFQTQGASPANYGYPTLGDLQPVLQCSAWQGDGTGSSGLIPGAQVSIDVSGYPRLPVIMTLSAPSLLERVAPNADQQCTFRIGNSGGEYLRRRTIPCGDQLVAAANAAPENPNAEYYARYEAANGRAFTQRLIGQSRWRNSPEQLANVVALLEAMTGSEPGSDSNRDMSRIAGILHNLAVEAGGDGEMVRVMNYARNSHQGVHPTRQQVLQTGSGWGNPAPDGEKEFHIVGIDNPADVEKYSHPDGREAVFLRDASGNWDVLQDGVNDATFNHVANAESGYQHMILDVFPWLLYGVSPDDAPNLAGRIQALERSGKLTTLRRLRPSNTIEGLPPSSMMTGPIVALENRPETDAPESNTDLSGALQTLDAAESAAEVLKAATEVFNIARAYETYALLRADWTTAASELSDAGREVTLRSLRSMATAGVSVVAELLLKDIMVEKLMRCPCRLNGDTYTDGQANSLVDSFFNLITADLPGQIIDQSINVVRGFIEVDQSNDTYVETVLIGVRMSLSQYEDGQIDREQFERAITYQRTINDDFRNQWTILALNLVPANRAEIAIRLAEIKVEEGPMGISTLALGEFLDELFRFRLIDAGAQNFAENTAIEFGLQTWPDR